MSMLDRTNGSLSKYWLHKPLANLQLKVCLNGLVKLFKFGRPETTVYSDRLSLHYPPISDVFDRVFFVHYTNDSTLTLLRNSLFNNNKKIFFSL